MGERTLGSSNLTTILSIIGEHNLGSSNLTRQFSAILVKKPWILEFHTTLPSITL